MSGPRIPLPLDIAIGPTTGRPRPGMFTPGGGGDNSPTPPGGLAVPSAPTPVASVPPFWLYKPPSGIDFYFNVTGVLAAGAGSTLVLGGTPPVTILNGYEGVVASVNIFVDAPTTTLDVTWALRFNQAPVPGWDRLRSFARTANNLSIEFSGFVQCGQNTLIDVLVSNQSAAGPWTVGVEVTGWYWSAIDRRRVYGDY
jgi:hypothetical protein